MHAYIYMHTYTHTHTQQQTQCTHTQTTTNTTHSHTHNHNKNNNKSVYLARSVEDGLGVFLFNIQKTSFLYKKKHRKGARISVFFFEYAPPRKGERRSRCPASFVLNSTLQGAPKAS